MSNVGVVKVRSFGEALALLREERGLSHRELAARVGVGKAEIKAWERNEGAPSAFQFKKLLGSIQRLWGFTSLLPKAERVAILADRAAERATATIPPPPPEPEPAEPPAIEEPPPPKTFGDALRAARLREGLDQHEVGTMLSVEQGTVSRWELEGNVPIAAHYAQLCDLFPSLKTAPKPVTEVRDIPKPVGNPYGVYRAVGEAPVERTPFVPPVPPMPVAPVEPPAQLVPAPLPAPKLDTVGEAGVAYAKALARSGEALARRDRLSAELDKAERECDAAVLAANEAGERLFSLTLGNRPIDPEMDRKMQAVKKRLRDSFLADVGANAKGVKP